MRIATSPSRITLLPAELGGRSDWLALGEQCQHRRAGHGNASRDAMMSGPSAIVILQLHELGLHPVIPLLPGFAAGPMQAVADVEIREELLATKRSKPADKLVAGELTGDR